MRRYGYGVTAKVLTNIIEEVLRARAPEMLEIVAKIACEPLTTEEREDIREVLADELLENGVAPDGEPNDRGRLVESAISWLGHQ